MFSEVGKPLSQGLVAVSMQFDTDGPTGLPKGLFPDPRGIPMKKTDANGIAKFDGIVVQNSYKIILTKFDELGK